MSRWKRMLSVLLVVFTLVSTMPVTAVAAEGPATDAPPDEVGGIAPNSLLPLDEYRATLDLTSYLPEELKAVPAAEVIEGLKFTGNTYEISNDAQIVYATGRYDADDNYTIITDWANDTMDLSPEREYDNRVYLELIVGTADQLDPNNIRIIVTVSITAQSDLFDFTIYTDDAPRVEVDVYNTYYSTDNNVYQIGVSSDYWEFGELVYLSMGLSQEFNSEGLTAAIYEGLYTTEEDAINAGATRIDDIWDQPDMSDSGGHLADYSYKSGYEGMPEVTAVLKRDGTTVCVLPFIIYMYGSRMSLQANSGLYAEEADQRIQVSSSWGYENNNYDTHVYTLDPGYAANGTYYFGLTLYDPNPDAGDGGTNGVNFVTKAVVGYYETQEEAQYANDIKTQLFSHPRNNGYGADFSNGVTFTVFTTTNQVLHYTIRTEAGVDEESLPSAPTPLSQDTYFRMRSASNGVGGTQYDAYVMPYDDDSYYYNGYQTVFLLDNGNEVTDGTTIYPVFETGNKVEVFAGLDVDGQTVSAVKQNSGETPVVFQNGAAISYSAAAENGSHLKNYWVTFVTKQSGGPVLFVNGVNYEGHYDGDENLPVREVFLTEEYGYHHDIFFSNIGDAQLTGLTVTLSDDAKNIALDEYWDIDATRTLAPFESTNRTESNGELNNVAKIRLVPATDENGNELIGEISGRLTISADGIDPVVIILKGTAGIPEITTESIVNGVMYVPYSSVIQTNNMYASDAIEFTLESGRLPAGVSLLTNGEIYGVPRESGSFTFTVSATYEGTAMEPKEFTLEVASNSNNAVWNYDQSIWGDDNYRINIAIPNDDGSVSSPNGTWETAGNSWDNIQQVFETEGTFAYFEAVWLDGVQLTPGADYTAEEGSTRITIRTQTLERNGSGTHTIAAEFRDGSDNLRRAAQNYTVSTTSSSTGGSSSGSSSSGSSSSGSSSSGSTSYNIEVEQADGGTITTNRSSASRGRTVTITVTPDAGFELDELIVTDRNGNRITVSQTAENQYTFTMPAGRVSIQAVFAAIPEPEPEPEPVPGLPFTDVGIHDWFVPYVTDVYARGLMVGTSATTFEPDSTTSRGMIVKILYNLEDQPEAGGTYFSDVPLNQFYTEAAAWAAENGIVAGYGDGRFGPDDPVTREQIVMILMRYAAYRGIDVASRADLYAFTDFSLVSADAMDATSWAYAEGLLNGKGNGILDPKGQATRAEVAAILSRFCQLCEDGDEQDE